MKFGITRYEKFALTSFLFGQQTPNMEIGRVRLRAWDELGTEELAQKLAFSAAGLGDRTIKVSDWDDHKTQVLVDLSNDVTDWIIRSIEGAKPGAWTDVLTRLHPRLCDLRDRKYKLPDELRERKLAAT